MPVEAGGVGEEFDAAGLVEPAQGGPYVSEWLQIARSLGAVPT